MAHVDITTGKIYGAEKGSKTYYHEKGHLIFNKIPFNESIRVAQEVSFKWILFSVALHTLLPLQLFKLLTLFFLLMNIFSEGYEEMWCWRYAIKQKKGNDKNRRKKAI